MSNTHNRMIVFASILGAILATGLLALNPSTITNVGAQMYGDQYGYDSNYYQDDNRYGYDNKHPEKKNVNVQKIKCVNSNINVNGVDITEIPQDGAGVSAANEGGPDGANTENGNALADRINVERNLVNVCANVNANEQVKVSPPEEPEEPGNLEIVKTVECISNNGEPSNAAVCQFVLSNIESQDYQMTVDDTNPQPPQFPGSSTGTNVQIEAGNYVVDEIVPFALLGQIQNSLGATSIINTVTIGPNSDCQGIFDGNNIFQEATGSISAGESQTCELINTLRVNGGSVPS